MLAATLNLSFGGSCLKSDQEKICMLYYSRAVCFSFPLCVSSLPFVHYSCQNWAHICYVSGNVILLLCCTTTTTTTTTPFLFLSPSSFIMDNSVKLSLTSVIFNVFNPTTRHWFSQGILRTNRFYFLLW